jgi:hypothetical protein
VVAGVGAKRKCSHRDTEAVEQIAAAFRFGIQDNKIDALPENLETLDPAISQDLYEELVAKAQAMDARLKRSNADPHAGFAVERLLRSLGARYDDVRPGLVLSRLRSIEGIVSGFDTEEGRLALFPDAIAMLTDLHHIAEMDNYPYSCWRLSPTRIRPIVRKRWLQIATLPGNRIGTVFPRVSPLFPEAVAAPNILYTGFTNANAMLHVANCVANAGRIESGNSYKFYAEGVTPAVARLYEAVAAALGVSVPSLPDWFDRVYGVRGATLVETCQQLTYNSDRSYGNAEVARSQIHRRRCPDRPHTDERFGSSSGSTNAGDRRTSRACPKDDRERLHGRSTHARALGTGWHGRAGDPTRCGTRVHVRDRKPTSISARARSAP